MEPIPAVLKNNQGQGLIESLVLSGALLTTVTVLFAVLYFGFVHLGAHYLLHELLVCEITVGAKNCEKDFRKKAQAFLFAVEIRVLETSSRWGQGQRARLVLKMPMGRSLTIKKELNLR